MKNWSENENHSTLSNDMNTVFQLPDSRILRQALDASVVALSEQVIKRGEIRCKVGKNQTMTPSGSLILL